MLNKLLKNKRGMALENAILFMLIIFSLCALLTSLTLIGHFQTNINKLTLENEIKLEQIGENFVASPQSFSEVVEYENYTCIPVGSENYAMAVYPKSDTEFKSALLYIEVAKDSGKILHWRYSLPENVH